MWALKYQCGRVKLDKLGAHMAPGFLKLFATLIYIHILLLYTTVLYTAHTYPSSLLIKKMAIQLYTNSMLGKSKKQTRVQWALSLARNKFLAINKAAQGTIIKAQANYFQ